MTEPFFGEIQLFGFNFAPRNWATCNGTTLPIRQNTALFSLLGTRYGGDGVNTFKLPNFVNRAATSQGQGPGLTQHSIGEAFGTNAVALTQQTVPAHSHSLTLYNQRDSSKRNATPEAGNYLGVPATGMPFVTNATANAQFSPRMIGASGGGQPHENRQPYLATNFCIALQGVFPSFS
ncbi:tail fiber protein [Stenotrophomonas sp. ZAC14D2_NAIMI4_6]|uniref:phage tail protein n=1 Tax=Stenotrophomonas sp. ZAC14D2_NAIMI4_6 TaxID=2072406 RepID=UPI000D53C5F0|nr:tail fiber protein [Stenotrophomonas sp. ZAC14D2_NAIMI4_6]AWH21562.1 microcystin-dependent protein [Stenotrophomonas sp. ZAC14D2_NAIMI4_6]